MCLMACRRWIDRRGQNVTDISPLRRRPKARRPNNNTLGLSIKQGSKCKPCTDLRDIGAGRRPPGRPQLVDRSNSVPPRRSPVRVSRRFLIHLKRNRTSLACYVSVFYSKNSCVCSIYTGYTFLTECRKLNTHILIRKYFLTQSL